jgi:hypothetical protein
MREPLLLLLLCVSLVGETFSRIWASIMLHPNLFASPTVLLLASATKTVSVSVPSNRVGLVQVTRYNRGQEQVEANGITALGANEIFLVEMWVLAMDCWRVMPVALVAV